MCKNLKKNYLAELPVRSVHTVTVIRYAKHYGQDKLVVQLDNSVSNHAGEFLEACKDRLLSGCKIIIKTLGWIKQEDNGSI